MGKIKFGFVILHYMAYEMTIECVDNLLRKFDEYSMHIVIVDNASPNASGKILKKKYESNSKVTVLLNENNDGFAKGNNIGYKFLKNNINPDYMIVMNNDVIIEQKEFLELIDSSYKEEKYAVMGPDIYCPATKKHQNPAHLRVLSKDEIQKLYTNVCKYVTYPAYYYYKHAIFGKIKRMIKGNMIKGEEIDRTKKLMDIVLHGACYILSKDFINVRNQCFCPKTFLYMEEDILHYECIRDGLKMIYDPQLKIKHMEDVSTDASLKSGYKKFKMKNNEMKKSIEIFLNVINSLGKG